MNLFNSTLKKSNFSRPPVWFMRQAGRYHSHYQALKEKHSFIELCKNPELACEVTMGPIRDFDFDAAILFSDLLFPLEAMGMGLRYEVGPKLDWHLREISDLKKLKSGSQLVEQIQFQGKALELIRKQLDSSKGLLGFVGGPLTLYFYAVEGSHQGSLDSAHQGIRDGRFEGFFDRLVDLLVENMNLQAQSGADAIAIMDTCAGEIAPDLYAKEVVPRLKLVLQKYKSKNLDVPIIYYSKGTHPSHWSSLVDLPIDGLGVDWRYPIQNVLAEWGDRWAIQGNVDPNWLFLEANELERKLREVFESVLSLNQEKRKGWICGLGHGVLPKTPESNVRLFLKLQKEMFSSKRIVEEQ